MDVPIYASKINLSNKGLKEIPPEIFGCRNLKKLNLSHNQIKVIPQELAKLKSLRNLDLSCNQIQNLYAKNFDFPHLEVLVLNNNRIRHLPRQIQKLSTLKKLSLAGNLLDSLPVEMRSLKMLTALNIAKNKFIEFPAIITQLTTLEKLFINGNAFFHFPLPDLSDKLSNLKALYTFGAIDTNSGIDGMYYHLMKKRGNALTELKLIALAQDVTRKIGNSITINQPDMTTKLNSIFISYSHADKHWLDKIKTALSTLPYEGLDLDTWDDNKIAAGTLWRTEIDNAIQKARVAILIISNEFLASKFIQENELPPLLAKIQNNGTRILPIIAKKCRFVQSRIGQYQAVNDPNRPLNALKEYEQDEEIYKLTESIVQAFRN